MPPSLSFKNLSHSRSYSLLDLCLVGLMIHIPVLGESGNIWRRLYFPYCSIFLNVEPINLIWSQTKIAHNSYIHVAMLKAQTRLN